MPGGKTEYKGFRKIVSILGNYVARKILKINLKEITTYFRVYDVSYLKSYRSMNSRHQVIVYSVKIVWFKKVMELNL